MTLLFSRTPLYIWHASQKHRLCKITGNAPLVQEILVKDSGFRRQSSYSWLRGEPRNEFCNTFFKKILWSSTKYRTPHTIFLLGLFFSGILIKSGKFGVPPPKDRYCCSYPNREEGTLSCKQE